MGTFIGHIDEAIFFLLISIWWFYNIFTEYIEVGCDSRKYKPRMSYQLKRFPRVPIEIILKTLFPFVGFMAEVFTNGPYFFDENGDFRAKQQNNWMHMSIYGFFVMHGIVDLLDWFKTPILKGMNYLTAATAFFWYGYAFYFHSTLHGLNKPPLETTVHILPIILMFGASVSGVIEYATRENGGILPQLVRSYFVFCLGTWFTFVSFVLYKPISFLHNIANPAWDRTDHRNVNFIVAAFGFHLNFNVVFIVTFYFILFYFHKFRQSNAYKKFSKLVLPNGLCKQTGDPRQYSKCDEEYKLLGDFDEEI